MRLHRGARHAPLASVAAALLAVLLAACSSSASKPATPAGLVGYKWAVAAISHDGKTTAVPASYPVYLQFTPDGHFGANDSVNYHSGLYKLTPSGFTTSDVAETLVGYAGHDPVVVVSVSAISALSAGAPAAAKLSGSTLTVTVGGYTLIAHRDATQPDWPATGPS